MLRMTVTLAAMVLAVPGLAQEAQKQPAPAPSPAPEKKICRSIVPTGSIMGRRYCLTRAEWARINDINDEGSAKAFRDKRSISCNKPLEC